MTSMSIDFGYRRKLQAIKGPTRFTSVLFTTGTTDIYQDCSHETYLCLYLPRKCTMCR